MDVPYATRWRILLEEVAEVVVGESGGKDLNLPTNMMCVTLIMDRGHAVAFQFSGAEERDAFASVLSRASRRPGRRVARRTSASGMCSGDGLT